MILSQPSKHGLRAVLYLAQHDPEVLLVKDIAEALHIPRYFLAKILQSLSKQGLLLSSKGPGGGFKLARPDGEVTLLDVVRTIEGDSFGEGCVLGLGECSEENQCQCPLHARWAVIKDEILQMLRDKTTMQLLEGVSRLDLNF